jgi:hypothetical protein
MLDIKKSDMISRLDLWIKKEEERKLKQFKELLSLWLGINLQNSHDKQWTIGGRTYTIADAAEIRANIEFWKRLAGHWQPARRAKETY